MIQKSWELAGFHMAISMHKLHKNNERIYCQIEIYKHDEDKINLILSKSIISNNTVFTTVYAV